MSLKWVQSKNLGFGFQGPLVVFKVWIWYNICLYLYIWIKADGYMQIQLILIICNHILMSLSQHQNVSFMMTKTFVTVS